jgi:hypothetical protein
MADAETLMNLEEDRAAVEEFLAEHDARLLRDEHDPAMYWLDVRPASAPHERFYPRLVWARYPDDPPSIIFADAIGGQLGIMAAWPICPGYRAPNDICKPLSAEGYALHPEWRIGPDAWPTEGNPFLWVAETLQFDLDNQYQGRAA